MFGFTTGSRQVFCHSIRLKGLGQLKDQKKAYLINLFERLAYLLFDNFFLNAIIRVSRNCYNFFIAKYYFIYELYAILARAKKRRCAVPTRKKPHSNNLSWH